MMMEEAIHDSLSLENEYTIIGDEECIDALPPHDQQTHYTNGRESLGQTTVLLPLPHAESVSCVSSRALGDSPSYPGAHSNSPESTSSGITSTGASHPNPLSFSSFQSHPAVLYPDTGPSNAYTGISQIFTGTYQVQTHHPVRSMLSALPETSTSSIPSPTRSLALNSSALSPPSSSTPRDTYSSGGLSHHRMSNSGSSAHTSRSFAEYRPVLAPHQTMSFLSTNPVYSSSTSPFSPTPRPQNDETPEFQPMIDFAQLKLEDGMIIRPEIICKIEKGFFQSGGSWTCYRRNYFSVVLQYSLGGTYPQAPLYLTKSEGGGNNRQERSMTEQVQALGVCLSAAVDGANGKVVELIQHTPKRDKGPQSSVKIAKILPAPASRTPRQNTDLHGYNSANYGVSPATPNVVQDPPLLPMQGVTDSNSADVPTATSHTFERIQFKNATANNGKRRAQQQYYHLKAELWADIRLDHTRIPVWVKVAHRVSNPVVVRGRSPSHYKNEGPTSQSRASSSSGVGSRPTPQWTGLRGIVGPGPTTSPYPSFGNTSYQPATYPSHGSSLPRFHSTNNDGYGMSSSADHNASSAQYLIALSDPSPMGGSRGLMNSPSGGTIMSTTGHDRVSEEEPSSSGYAYYPGALMEAGLANPKASVKREGPGRPQDSPSGQLQSNYRMVGLETSRGIYNWGGT